MAWTARLESAERIGLDAVVRVVYTDGVQTIAETLRSADGKQIKQTARNRLAQLAAADAYVAAAAPGVIDVSEPAPVVPTPPTQAELDRAAWLLDYQRWLKVKTGIDAGIIDATAAAVVALKSKVIAGFKPAYVPFL